MMKHLNKKNNRYVIIAATIFTLAIMTASTLVATPTAATTTTISNATTSASGLELSPQPVCLFFNTFYDFIYRLSVNFNAIIALS
jgi:hypothetical protein